MACASTAPSHHNAISECANHSIGVIAGHWMLALGGGVLIGALAGAAVLILLARARVA